MRILLVEDDPILGDGLQVGLRQSGFLVDWVRDGLAAEYELVKNAAGEQSYAAVVLDLGLLWSTVCRFYSTSVSAALRCRSQFERT